VGGQSKVLTMMCDVVLKNWNDNDSEGILWHSGDVELHNEGKNINLHICHLVDMSNAAQNC
jgi:calcineurin-like phosphoesterase family protein